MATQAAVIALVVEAQNEMVEGKTVVRSPGGFHTLFKDDISVLTTATASPVFPEGQSLLNISVE